MNGVFTRGSKYCRYYFKRVQHTTPGEGRVSGYAEGLFRRMEKQEKAYNKIMAVLAKIREGEKNGQ